MEIEQTVTCSLNRKEFLGLMGDYASKKSGIKASGRVKVTIIRDEATNEATNVVVTITGKKDERA